MLNAALSKIEPGCDATERLVTLYLVTNLLVIGWYSSPAAYGTRSRVMPLRRTVLPPKVDEPEVVVVPLGLG